MVEFGIVVWILPLLAVVYSADECNWRGSGLSHPHSGVEQVFLRCAEGSVEFLYPTGALRLTLSPRLQWIGPGHTGGGGNGNPTSVCVKPEPQWAGAQLYLERGGVLELLVSDAPGRLHIRCFSITLGESATLFLQATPHSDISRRIAAFRYELRGDWMAWLPSSVDTETDRGEGACRPCNDTEMLMAVCTSDFVVRGNIRAVDADSEQRISVIKVSATRVYRQKIALFSSVGLLTHSGEIRTLLRCGVRAGSGSFLFTGHTHFGEAWLTCAPRYKDFLRVYEHAKQELKIPCTLDT